MLFLHPLHSPLTPARYRDSKTSLKLYSLYHSLCVHKFIGNNFTIQLNKSISFFLYTRISGFRKDIQFALGVRVFSIDFCLYSVVLYSQIFAACHAQTFCLLQLMNRDVRN